MISLHPFDRGSVARVQHITVAPEQVKFAGTVDDVLVPQAETLDLYEIHQDGAAVGIFRIDRAYHLAYDFAAPADLGLRGVIVDRNQQGQGVGRKAMAELKRFLPPLYPDRTKLWLTVNMANPAAIAVYEKAGFADTGNIWPHGKAGPQKIMFLPLEQGAIDLG